MGSETVKRRYFTSFQIIILGFALVILLGALLLMLPISSQSGMITSLNQTLFTATSAVCVTGLVVQDTGTYWSTFGHTVIICLIQIGGLGVITFAASFALLSGKKISLMQRTIMQDAISAPRLGGIVRLTYFILKGTFLFEFCGALIMMPVFVKDYGIKGVGMAFFHSISAFCNAGFDILGKPDAKFSSLTAYSGNVVINITIMLLIVIGGIGFLTWEDIYTYKFKFKKYRMQSKVILVTTLFLILVPAIFYFFVEYSNLSIKERLLCSFFQAITPRTAGFNTTDLSLLSGAGQLIMIVLMLIGGSPGSTAGGMKTTTFSVLFANGIANFRRKEHPEFFGRRIDSQTVKIASTVLTMYIVLFTSGAIIISVADKVPILAALFETSSAVATVGSTLGLTPSLGITSQMVLIILMFLGRVGGLTLIYATLSGNNKKFSKLPQERIIVA